MSRNDSNRFHLAIEAGDLDMTVPWYTNVLGCSLDMKEEGRWQDINFWGNELTLHATDPDKKNVNERHNVDMGNVTVPHFGVHLDSETFQKLKQRLIDKKIEFIDPPYIRFKGEDIEQETMFLEDPNGNCMEIKTMKNPSKLFKN